MLMLCGVGLFAILSGAFAAWFMAAEEKDLDEHEFPAEELLDLRSEIQVLRAEIRESSHFCNRHAK